MKNRISITTCETCGSEIVESINDSNFHEGECGPCEYHRYRTQPELLHACGLALDEIDQWVEVIGGSEDPRTAFAVHALVAAIAEATGVDRSNHCADRDPHKSVPQLQKGE